MYLHFGFEDASISQDRTGPLRRGIPAKAITLLSGLLIDEDQWKELVEKGGGTSWWFDYV